MAKRFTDSRKWDDDWFLGLPSHYKLLWLYMLDKCDHAGFFKPNLKLANFCIDFDFKKEDIFKWFGERIKVIGDKWFLPKYIAFQYGYLTLKNNMYKPVIKLLQDNGKGLTSPFVAPYKGVGRGKGIGKGIGIDIKKGKEGNIYSEFENSLLNAWNSLSLKYPILSKVLSISTERRKHLKQRFENKHFRDNINTAFEKVAESGFLRGRNDREWRVTFDWFIANNNNYLKVLENRYKDKSKEGIERFIGK